MRIDMDNAISLLNIKNNCCYPTLEQWKTTTSDWEENQHLSGFTLTKKVG
jgi:hypothetical protein